MTPAEITTALRRVCEIADMALQGAESFTEADDRALKRVEALVEVLERQNDTSNLVANVDRPRRAIVLDDPEDQARAQEVVEAADELMEVNCATCHDTKRVMRQDRHGHWYQTAALCPDCAVRPITDPSQFPSLMDPRASLDDAVAGITSLGQAMRHARDAIRRQAEQATAVPEQIRYRDMYLRPGMELSADQRNYLRGLSQNGADASRLLAREILDREPVQGVSELWSFAQRGSVRLGQRLDLWQYQRIANVAFSTDDSYSEDQIAKAQRFIDALPDQNRWRLEQEDRDSRQGPPSF